jgi:hypothetical protein
VPKRIFGPKRDETKGGWRKLHNEECQNKKNEMGWTCGTNAGVKK